jgi:hypothetical protein
MNIVQIGCSVGKDEVSEIISQNLTILDKIILVDMNPNSLNVCREYYSKISDKIIFLNLAIVGDDLTSSIEGFYPKVDPISPFTSVSKNHVFRHIQFEEGPAKKEIESFSVPAMSINRLFKEYKIDKLDYLYIDAENLDQDIVDSIDFSDIIIQNLIFEHIHIQREDLKRVWNKLRDNNYMGEYAGYNFVCKKRYDLLTYINEIIKIAKKILK